MTRQGYHAAGRIERAMRVLRDCGTIKDPLKIADRHMLAFHDFAYAAGDGARHRDPVYREATANALAAFLAQIKREFPRRVAEYTDARKAMIAGTKGGKRQRTIALKTLDTLTAYANANNWQGIPPACAAASTAAIVYWRDQAALLEPYA